MTDQELQYINEGDVLSWLRSKLTDVVNRVKTTGIQSGGFYLLNYSSKLYEEDMIDYYDTVPIILALGNSGGYVLGLNTGYLPIAVKRKFHDRLSSLYPKQFEENKILPNVSWRSLKSPLEEVRPGFIIKTYIRGRISKAVRIKTKDVENTLRIDLSAFVGTSVNSVWKYFKAGVPPNIIPTKKMLAQQKKIQQLAKRYSR